MSNQAMWDQFVQSNGSKTTKARSVQPIPIESAPSHPKVQAPPPPPPVAVEPTMDIQARWLAYLRVERNLSPNTIRLYERVIDEVLKQVGPLETITTDDIRVWLHARGGQAGSVGNRISALRSVFKFMSRAKVRAENPMDAIDAPRRHKGVPKPIKDIAAKLRALDEQDARVHATLPNDKKHLRPLGQSRAMVTFLTETGLRIHEAVAMDIEVPCPEILVLIGKGHKEALLPLTEEARQASDFLGGKWPIGARATQRRFEKAGFTPHQCRHHLGCSLAEAGADLGEIQDLLRHSSPATTRGYAAYSTERLRAAQARRKASA